MEEEVKVVDKKEKGPILQILYKTFISEANQNRIKKIPTLLLKWLVGFFCGIVVGFLMCYFYQVISNKQQYDWKIVTGLLASLGAIITAIIANTKSLMAMALDKGKYHLMVEEHNNKKIDVETMSDSLSKELLVKLDEKLFQSDTIYELRSKHYAEEKLCIAKKYIKLLGKRICSLLEGSQLEIQPKVDEVVIILDSG